MHYMSIPLRPGRLSRDTSVSSDTSATSEMSTNDSEAPFLHKSPLHSQKTPSKWLVILLILSVTMSGISCMICALIFAGTLQPVISPTPEPQPVCLPCQKLVTIPFQEQDTDIDLLDRHFENRTAICCAKTPKQFSLMFDKLVYRKMKASELKVAQQAEGREPLPFKNQSNIAGAHVLAGLQNKGVTSRVLRWISDHPLSYLKGLHLADDRVVVEHSGLYLVYSQIYFKVPVDKHATGRRMPRLLGHQVHRYSVTIPNDGKQDLLQSAHSCCGDPGNEDKLFFHTSHVVGVFKLSARDEIYVTVSDPSLVYRDSTRSFLGIFSLR